MKDLLDCDDLTFYNQMVAQYYNIQIGRYNEYKIENKIKEPRLQWLGHVQDFLIYKISIKNRLKRQKAETHFLHSLFEEWYYLEMKEIEEWKQELINELESIVLLLLMEAHQNTIIKSNENIRRFTFKTKKHVSRTEMLLTPEQQADKVRNHNVQLYPKSNYINIVFLTSKIRYMSIMMK